MHRGTLLNVPCDANLCCLYSFTACRNIVQIVAETLTVYTFIQFFDALLVRHLDTQVPRLVPPPRLLVGLTQLVCVSHCQCVCSGILVGCGMQKIAALSNLVAYYCIALPVGAALMFEAQLKILGNYSAIRLDCCCLYLLDQRPALSTRSRVSHKTKILFPGYYPVIPQLLLFSFKKEEEKTFINPTVGKCAKKQWQDRDVTRDP